MTTNRIEKLLLRRKSSEAHRICIENVPEERSVVMAYFMVKANLDDADADAVISKTVFPGETADGVIINDGNNDSREAEIEVIIDNDDVDPLDTRRMYISAVKVILDNGMAYQPPYTRRPVRILAPIIDAVT